ncbi:MAG: hypothetical protein R3C28_12180 [Pirellulaceae bacterium]
MAIPRIAVGNLVRVKSALADKYDRLARARKSKPLKAKLARQAERFRRDAERIAGRLSS